MQTVLGVLGLADVRHFKMGNALGIDGEYLFLYNCIFASVVGTKLTFVIH